MPNQGNTMNAKERVRTWRVRTTPSGVVLTINGKEYDLGSSGSSIAFDIERAASGVNAPETERTV